MASGVDRREHRRHRAALGGHNPARILGGIGGVTMRDKVVVLIAAVGNVAGVRHGSGRTSVGPHRGSPISAAHSVVTAMGATRRNF